MLELGVDSSRDIEPVTALKRDAAELIKRARETAAPIVITQNGRATAVLQDVESYERQRRALLLLKILAQGDADHEAGRTATHKQAGRAIGRRLASLKKGG